MAPMACRLDVSGVAHLFGGERGLIADVARLLRRAGFATRCAIAPTPAAAWALARFGQDGTICGADIAAALAPLPVAALRLSPLATRTLERLGLKTIEALAGIERRSLARRFREADNPLDALDRALGPQARAADRRAPRAAAARDASPGRAGRRIPRPACPGARPAGPAAGRRARGAQARRAAAVADRLPGRRRASPRPRSRPRSRAASRRISSACSPTRRRRSTPASASTPSRSPPTGPSRWARRRTAWSRSRRARPRWRGWSTG